jgi:hypothetical protein
MAILWRPDPKSKQGAVLASQHGRKEFPRLPVFCDGDIKRGDPPERRLGLISECPVQEQARPTDDRVLGAGAGSDGTGTYADAASACFPAKTSGASLYDT